MLRRLAADATALRFDITTTNSVEAARLLADGLVDVAMVSSHRPAGPDATVLCRQRFYWIAPRRGRAAAQTLKARLGKEPLLRLGAGSQGRRVLDEMLARLRLQPPSTIDVPGVSLMLSYARQGLGIYAYNSYQSVIRGGHSWLRLRVSPKKPLNQGDQVDALIALNQDTLDRHLRELRTGGLALFNSDKVEPSYDPPAGVQLCPLPVPELTPAYKELPVMQNTVAVGAVTRLMGLEFTGVESVLESTFAKKPKVVPVNVSAARAGYDYAAQHFKPLPRQLSKTNQKWTWLRGNELFAMGAAMAGCKFYCAYPMSPATHVLEWFATHGKELSICVRQVEDEISVINMTIGAGHMGVRSMCATSGGGFALMTEAVGMSGMIETPVVVINVMRAGPSTGVPTKTEQADLNQAFGASQGDFPRVIMA